MTPKQPPKPGSSPVSPVGIPAGRVGIPAGPPSPPISLPRQQPFVRPGEQLHFVQKLREKGFAWPLPHSERHPTQDIRRPALTPFLVIPASPGDIGDRTATGQSVLFNGSVQVLDNAGRPVFSPKPGTGSYTLACQVTNLGNLGAFGGLIEFYVGSPTDFETAAKQNQPMRAIGYEGFSINPGETRLVKCRHPWTPGTGKETVLVQAYDAFSDRILHRFDASNDRHVGRRDSIVGRWDGEETVTGPVPTQIRKVSLVFSPTNVAVYRNGDLTNSVAMGTVPTVVNGQLQFTADDGAGFLHRWTLFLTPTGLIITWDVGNPKMPESVHGVPIIQPQESIEEIFTGRGVLLRH